jgi:hypothetical protein
LPSFALSQSFFSLCGLFFVFSILAGGGWGEDSAKDSTREWSLLTFVP